MRTAYLHECENFASKPVSFNSSVTNRRFTWELSQLTFSSIPPNIITDTEKSYENRTAWKITCWERFCVIIISMIFRIITTRQRSRELDRYSVTYCYYSASLFVLPETNFRIEITNMKEQRAHRQLRTFCVFICISDSQPVDLDSYRMLRRVGDHDKRSWRS